MHCVCYSMIGLVLDTWEAVLMFHPLPCIQYICFGYQVWCHCWLVLWWFCARLSWFLRCFVFWRKKQHNRCIPCLWMHRYIKEKYIKFIAVFACCCNHSKHLLRTFPQMSSLILPRILHVPSLPLCGTCGLKICRLPKFTKKGSWNYFLTQGVLVCFGMRTGYRSHWMSLLVALPLSNGLWRAWDKTG